MVSFSVLASSSAGNCSVFSVGDTHILIDAGLSASVTFKRLAELGIAPESISAILVTHEHGDHIAGLPVIARKLDRMVCCTQGTGATIPHAIVGLDAFLQGKNQLLGIDSVQVRPFALPHDAAEPVGFSLTAEGIKVSVVTDLGEITPVIATQIADSDVLLLESNHDMDMLAVGPQPKMLRERIALQHLSNDQVCAFLHKDHPNWKVSQLILGHLSADNNRPEIVRLMATEALADAGRIGTSLTVADRMKTTGPFIY